VAEVLRNSGAEVVVNFLPAGADEASKFYAGESVKAECAFINATPSPIATNPSFSRKFEEAKLPVIGDDIMSQIGGTIFHKNILEFLSKRGVKILNTYQLDIGGGMETYNTLELSRRMLKRQIKTETIKSALPYEADIIAGTTDYVDFMENSRTSYFWIKGQYFLDTPVEIDIYLRTMDAPNSGTIIIDSIRAAKLALLRGVGGPLTSVCAYGYKSPPIRAKIDEAQKWFIEFLEGKRQR
jgi:myo-inositol-1-phosphate synthase